MEMEWFCHPNEAMKWYEFWTRAREVVADPRPQVRTTCSSATTMQDELAHYSKEGAGTVDIEYRFPFTAPDFGELEGIAHRGDYDLNAQHQDALEASSSTTSMPRVKNERYLPNVIEPAAGLTRGVLVLLCEAYTIDADTPEQRCS